ncbi:histidine triad nucleotide-binding protein [Myxococcota bacterium]|nr:histidine triad nucleotide-binding protein [Myxococcota bacterium]MBU1429127.1 histidine triad nucleotide-binding protein [Myxococcota bacterium]MBU1899759.1 histidine triad nucleotide-binding protein [Myxococcota bacterium]
MSTIFGRILNGEIPATRVWEDEDGVAFRDVNPQAPTHILLIPRKPIARLSEMAAEDAPLIGRLMHAATQIAAQEGLTDARYVINDGAGAGQTVFHLHIHIIGGRDLGWPPG